jgi:hypothetical protein
VAITGGGFGTTLRNGMKVLNVAIGHDLRGRHGTFGLPVRFDEMEMQSGVNVQVGIWKIVEGSGAYSSVSGGGRYVALLMPNGGRLVRQEGWVNG